MPTITPASNSPAASLLNIAAAPKPAGPISPFDQALRTASKKPAKADPQTPRKPDKLKKPVAKDSQGDGSVDEADASQPSDNATETANNDAPSDSTDGQTSTGNATDTKQGAPAKTQADGEEADEADPEASNGVSLPTAATVVAAIAANDDLSDDPSIPPAQKDEKEASADDVSDSQLTSAQAVALPQSTPATLIKNTTAKSSCKSFNLPVAPPKGVVKVQPTSPTPASSNSFVTKTTTVVDDIADAGNADDSADSPKTVDTSAPAQTAQTASTTVMKKATSPQLPKFALQAVQPDDATAAAPENTPKPSSLSSAISAMTQAAAFVSGDDSTGDVTSKSEAKLDDSSAIAPSQLFLTDKPAAHATASTALPHAAAPTAAEVTANNHDHIVQVVKSDLTPGGGSMKIRLDPPELGALQVTVKMTEGVMTASFETSSDQATKMLSHSLGQLKTALESAGVSVEKLHVQQSPKDSSSSDSRGNRDESRQQQARGSDTGEQQREQQRREMIRRMWAKLGVGDPLDLVA